MKSEPGAIISRCQTARGVIALGVVGALLSGCSLILGDGEERTNVGSDGGNVTMDLIDQDGAIIGTYVAGSRKSQTISGQDSAALTIMPGAFSVDTQVGLRAASSLTDESTLGAVGIDSSNVQSAGAPIEIFADTTESPAVAMQLQLPLPILASLQGGSGYENLVIIYVRRLPLLGKFETGVIPRADILIQNGAAIIGVKYFGKFQTAILVEPISEAIAAVTQGEPAPAAGTTTEQAATTTTAGVSVTIASALTTANSSNSASYALTGTCSENGRSVFVMASINGTSQGMQATCASGAWAGSLDLSSMADGSLGVTADHQSASGVSATQATATLVKDVSAPTATISGTPLPVAYGASITSYGISGTCSDNGRALTIVVSDGLGSVTRTVTCTSGSWAANFDLSTLSDGSVTTSITYLDAAGNSASISPETFLKGIQVTVAIDASVTHVNAANAAAYALVGDCSEEGRAVSVAATDSTSTSATISVNCSISRWSATINVASLTDGAITITADHQNASAIAATQASIVRQKDVVVPTVGINTLSSINVANAASYSVSGSCSEASRTVTIDFSGSISGTATCNGSSWSLTKDVSGLADGSVTVTADLSDTAGNAAVQVSDTVNKDTVSPTITVDTLSTATTSNVSSFSVSGSCSDSGGNITIDASDSIAGSIAAINTSCLVGSWNESINLSSLADGVITILVSHSDAVNNTGSDSDTTTKDATAPSVTLVSAPSQAAIHATGSATLNVTCSETGQAAIKDQTSSHYVLLGWFNVTGGDPEPATIAGSMLAAARSSAALGDGTSTLAVYCKDAAGNLGSADTSQAITLDTVAPTGYSLSIDGAAETNSPTVNLTISGGDAAQMYITNTSGCTADGTWEPIAPSKSAWSLAGANSTQYIYAKFRDVAGNETSCISDSVLHDNVAPSLASVSLVGTYGSSASASPSASWTSASANGGTLSHYEVSVGTSAGGTEMLDWTGIGNVQTATASGLALTSGNTYHFNLRAVDVAGNVSSIVSDSWIVDAVPPAAPSQVWISRDGFGPATAISGVDDDEDLYVQWNSASDVTSGIESYTLFAYPEASCGGTPTTVSGLSVTEHLFNGAFGSTYSFRVRAFDNAGLIADSPCSSNSMVLQSRVRGTIDASFHNNIAFVHNFGGGPAHALDVVALPNGEVVVVGFATEGGYKAGKVLKLNRDGLPVPGFGIGGFETISLGGHTVVRSVAYSDADDTIVVAGTNNLSTIGADIFVVKLNPNTGAIYGGFNGGSPQFINVASNADEATGIAVDNSGYIFVSGNRSNGTTTDGVLAWLNADGSMRADIGGATGLITVGSSGDYRLHAVAADSSGRVIVAGGKFASGGFDTVIRAYLPDGSLDASYNGNGEKVHSFATSSIDDQCRALAVHSSDAVACVGDRSASSWVALQVDSTGSSDLGFNSSGNLQLNASGPTSVAHDVVLDSLGNKSVVVGSWYAGGPLARIQVLNADGTSDVSFNYLSSLGDEDALFGVTIDSDNRVFAVGKRLDGGADSWLLMRLHQ